MKTVGNAEMRAWEEQAFSAGTTAESLMEQAVAGLLSAWKSRFPRPGQVLFFCGKGHNGNDGLWLAEELRRCGWKIAIVLSHPPAERKIADSAAVRASLQRASVWPRVPSFPTEEDSVSILVDALLGNGAAGPPRGIYAEILAGIKHLSSRCDFKISLDIPSGLDADSGEAHPEAFRADLTLCLGAVKQGLLRDRSRPWIGRLERIPLPLPERSAETSSADYFERKEARALARRLPASTYKHQRGTLCVWAGSPGMGGAAVLAARAGLRAGAGLVRLFTHPGLMSAMLQSGPEIMCHPFSSPEIPASFAKANAWILGPGIGLNEENAVLLQNLLASAPCPVVLDADALTLIARNPAALDSCTQPVLLTPHHGELERLLGKPFRERSDAAEEWLEQHPSNILVAKGPNTLVAAAGFPHSFNASGNPGMASAGMGDVLSGILGSLLAQGHAPRDAARLGVYWHGLAADLASRELTEQCLNACDLISYLGKAWKEIID